MRWPALFAAEAQRILELCGPLPLVLEHIGGTSIPGMSAKPILDIAAGRPTGSSLEEYVTVLRHAGYEHRGERGVPGRQYFRRGQPHSHHVHLVEHDGALWRDYLAFRDYLRTHPESLCQFAETKRTLATLYASDRQGYMEAKSSHVEAILRLAGLRLSQD